MDKMRQLWNDALQYTSKMSKRNKVIVLLVLILLFVGIAVVLRNNQPGFTPPTVKEPDAPISQKVLSAEINASNNDNSANPPSYPSNPANINQGNNAQTNNAKN